MELNPIKHPSPGHTYRIYTWFERDRACVELRCEETQNTVLAFWDEEVEEEVECGFIDPTNWFDSMVDRAIELGALPSGYTYERGV